MTTKSKSIIALVVSLFLPISIAHAAYICGAKGGYRSCEDDSVGTITGVGEGDTLLSAQSRALTACKERDTYNFSYCLFADVPYTYRLVTDCAVVTCSNDSAPSGGIQPGGNNEAAFTLKVSKRVKVKKNQRLTLYIVTSEAASISLVGKLPRGLRFYSARVITGKISKRGSYSVTVRASLKGAQKTARSAITVR